MRKIPSKKKFSAFIIFFITIFALIIGFRTLSHGIQIQHFKVADIHINGFYLKLDKKFIVEIDEINLIAKMNKQSKKDSNLDAEQISSYVRYALWGIVYFERLSVKKIALSNEYNASILYNGEDYSLIFPKIQALFAVQNHDNKIELNIKSLYIANPDMQVAGKIIYSMTNGQFGFGLSVIPALKRVSNLEKPVSTNNFRIFLQGSSDFKRLMLKAHTSKMQDINMVRTFIAQNTPNLTPILDKWLFQSLRFSTIEIKKASFLLQLNKRHFKKSLLENTNLVLSVTKPQYTLSEGISPFVAQSATLKIANRQIDLELNKPQFDSTKLDGSNLVFKIVDATPVLSIYAKSESVSYTQSLRDLLALYHIQIPIDTIQAHIKAQLDIHIPFAPDAKVAVAGSIKAQNGIINALGLDFITKSAEVAIKINPSTNESYLDIWTQNTSYENLFHIDTKSHLNLLDKKLATSLYVHSLRISTNPEINQRLISPQDLFKRLDDLDSENHTKQSSLLRPTNKLSMARLDSLARPYMPAFKIPRLSHYAQNNSLATDTNLDIPKPTSPIISPKKPAQATAPTEILVPSTTDPDIIAPANPAIKPIESVNAESDQLESGTIANKELPSSITIHKPDITSAPAEEIIDFEGISAPTDPSTPIDNSQDLDAILDSNQDDNTAESNNHTTESSEQEASILTQDSNEQESNQVQESQEQPESDSMQEVEITEPSDKNLTQAKPKSKVVLDFTKPMSPQEMQEKIIALIKQQEEQKFTYDIFKATKEQLPQIDLEVDFNQTMQISIPMLDVNVQILEDGIYAKIANFGKFAPYSPLMQYLGLSQGSANIYLKSAHNVEFQVAINNYPSFLLDKQKNILRDFIFKGTYKGDKLHIASDNGLIQLDLYDNTTLVIFNDIDIDIDAIISSKIPAFQEAFSTSDEKKVVFTKEQILLENEFLRQKRRYEHQNGIKPKIIAIEAKNMVGFFKSIVLPFDDFNAKIRDDRISADATYKNGIANIDIIHGNVLFKAGNFSGEFLNRVIGEHVVEGGLFEMSGIYKNDIFNGEIKIQNTALKSFAIVQNVIGLIDTIPSLIMFRSPSLSTKGYEIKKGEIKISLNAQYIGLESIKLIGKSIDVMGNGIIELETQEIDMGLSISTLKNLSNILNKIPVVGYLLLGKDGRVTTQVNVRGTMKDPQTQISLAKDLLSTPLKVLQRAFAPVDIVIDEIIKNIER